MHVHAGGAHAPSLVAPRHDSCAVVRRAGGLSGGGAGGPVCRGRLVPGDGNAVHCRCAGASPGGRRRYRRDVRVDCGRAARRRRSARRAHHRRDRGLACGAHSRRRARRRVLSGRAGGLPAETEPPRCACGSPAPRIHLHEYLYGIATAPCAHRPPTRLIYTAGACCVRCMSCMLQHWLRCRPTIPCAYTPVRRRCMPHAICAGACHIRRTKLYQGASMPPACRCTASLFQRATPARSPLSFHSAEVYVWSDVARGGLFRHKLAFPRS